MGQLLVICSLFGSGGNIISLTAERPQYSSGLVTFLIESSRKECFGADLVSEFIDRAAKLHTPAPDLVEPSFALGLGFVPRTHDCELCSLVREE